MSGFCFGNDRKILECKQRILENPTEKEIEKILALKTIECLTQLTQLMHILENDLTVKLCPDRRHGSTKNRIIIKQEFDRFEEAIEDFKSTELEKLNEN